MAQDEPLLTVAEQVSWRTQVLQGMLWVFTLIGGPVGVLIVAANARELTRPAPVLAFMFTTVVVLLTLARQWSLTLRAGGFIGVTYASGLLAVLYYGFTLGPGLLMLLVVVLCGLFFGPRWLWGGLLATGASLVGVGALHAVGLIATQRPELLDFTQIETVVRVTLAYFVLAGTIAVSMSYVVRRIEQSLHETSEILARYEAERQGRADAEMALRESEATYRQLVEDVNDVIYALDAKGVLTYLSPAVEAQSGYQRAELIGRVFSDFVYAEDRERVVQQFERAIAGEPNPSEYRVVTKSGEIRWIRSSSRPIYREGHEGQIVGLRGVFIDITDKRELEAQLRQAHKMEAMGTLAGGIAHEFNNNLSAILGFTDLAQRELPEHSVGWDHLQQVLAAGYRARDLVEQILVFSRQSEPTREPLSLSKAIQDVYALLRASLPATIELQLRINREVGSIMANPTQLHQVLMNLCSNAEYAMRETGGTLTLGIDTVEVGEVATATHADVEAGSWVRLTVRDTGGGIPDEIINRIFDPFFTTKGIGEGTGMGLAIAHGIVVSHGGRLTVQSEAGEGTEFTLYFPQLSEPVAAIPDAVTEDLRPGTGRILFVDDEEMLVRLGQGMLEHLGYEVVTYTSSLDALHAFRADPQQYDAVITDQTMPVMTGASLVEELRRVRADIPIILCTGFSHLMDAEKAQALGVDAFVMKPGVTQELALALQRVLDQYADRS